MERSGLRFRTFFVYRDERISWEKCAILVAPYMKRVIVLTILAALDQKFQEKGMPLKSHPIQNGQYLYQGKFNLDKEHSLPFGVVIAKDESESDFQISYRKLAYLNNYADKVNLLELINELNQTKTFYYTLCLAGDGEIFLRLLGRSTTDVKPLYEMLVIGSNIAKVMTAELKSKFPSLGVE